MLTRSLIMRLSGETKRSVLFFLSVAGLFLLLFFQCLPRPALAADSIFINTPDGGIDTGARSLDVAGTAVAGPSHDNIDIQVNGDLEYWGGFSTSWSFLDVSLDTGVSKLKVTLYDTAGIPLDTDVISVRRHPLEITSPENGHETGAEQIDVAGRAPGSQAGDTVRVRLDGSQVGVDTVASAGDWLVENIPVDTGVGVVSAGVFVEEKPGVELGSDSVSLRRHNVKIDTPGGGETTSRRLTTVAGVAEGAMPGDSVVVLVQGTPVDTLPVETADSSWSTAVSLDRGETNQVEVRLYPDGPAAPYVDTAGLNIRHVIGNIQFTSPGGPGEKLDTGVATVDLSGTTADAVAGDSIRLDGPGEDTRVTTVQPGQTWDISGWSLSYGKNILTVELLESDTASPVADSSVLEVWRLGVNFDSPDSGSQTTAAETFAAGRATASNDSYTVVVSVAGGGEWDTTVRDTAWRLDGVSLNQGETNILSARLYPGGDTSVAALNSDTTVIRQLQSKIAVNVPDSGADFLADTMVIGGTVAEAPPNNVIDFVGDGSGAPTSVGSLNASWERSDYYLDTGTLNTVQVDLRDSKRGVVVDSDVVSVRHLMPEISILRPRDGANTGADHVTVAGTVADSHRGDSITVFSGPGVDTVYTDVGTGDTWQTSVALGDSENVISARLHAADTAASIVAADTVQVGRHTIGISSPADGHDTGREKVSVSGVVANTIDADTVSVAVNGSFSGTGTIQSDSRWTVTGVGLDTGQNSVQASVNSGGSSYNDWISVRRHDVGFTSPANGHRTDFESIVTEGVSNGSRPGDSIQVSVNDSAVKKVPVKSDSTWWAGGVPLDTGPNSLEAAVIVGGNIIDTATITVKRLALRIAFPDDGYETTAHSLTLSGSAVGHNPGDSVVVENSAGDTLRTKVLADSSWQVPGVYLADTGANNLIKATLFDGSPADTASVSETVTVRQRYPLLHLVSPGTLLDTGSAYVDFSGTATDARPGDSISITGGSDTYWTTVSASTSWIKQDVILDSGLNNLTLRLYEHGPSGPVGDSLTAAVRVHRVRITRPENKYDTAAGAVEVAGFSLGSVAGDSIMIHVNGDTRGTGEVQADSSWAVSGVGLDTGVNRVRVSVLSETRGFDVVLDSDTVIVRKPAVRVLAPDTSYHDTGTENLTVGGEVVVPSAGDSVEVVVSTGPMGSWQAGVVEADTSWQLSGLGLDTGVNVIKAILYDSGVGSTELDSYQMSVRRHRVEVTQPADTRIETLDESRTFKGLSEGSAGGDTVTLRLDPDSGADRIVAGKVSSGAWEFPDVDLFLGQVTTVYARVHSGDSSTPVVHSDSFVVRQLDPKIYIDRPVHNSDTSARQIDVEGYTIDAPWDNKIQRYAGPDVFYEETSVDGGTGQDTWSFNGVDLDTGVNKMVVRLIKVESDTNEVVDTDLARVRRHQLELNHPVDGYETSARTIDIYGRSQGSSPGDSVGLSLNGGGTEYLGVENDGTWGDSGYQLGPDSNVIRAGLYPDTPGGEKIDSVSAEFYRHAIFVNDPPAGYDTTASAVTLSGTVTEVSGGDAVSVTVGGNPVAGSTAGAGGSWSVSGVSLPPGEVSELVARVHIDGPGSQVLARDTVTIWRRVPSLGFDSDVAGGESKVDVSGTAAGARPGDSVELSVRDYHTGTELDTFYTKVSSGDSWLVEAVELSRPEVRLVAVLYESDTAGPVGDTATRQVGGPARSVRLESPFRNQLVPDTTVEVNLVATYYPAEEIVVETLESGSVLESRSLTFSGFAADTDLSCRLESGSEGSRRVRVTYTVAAATESVEYIRDRSGRTVSYPEALSDTRLCHESGCSRQIEGLLGEGLSISISDTVTDRETSKNISEADYRAARDRYEVVEKSLTRVEKSDTPPGDTYVLRLPFDPGLLLRPPSNLEVYRLDETGQRWVRAGVVDETVHDTWVEAAVNNFSVYRLLAARPGAGEKGLADLVVGPNPFRPNDGRDRTGRPNGYVDFEFNSASSKFLVEIFTVRGELVHARRTSADPYEWDTKNESGSPVASGTYIYRVEDLETGSSRTGKLTIIR